VNTFEIVIYFCDSKAEFTHYSSLQCHIHQKSFAAQEMINVENISLLIYYNFFILLLFLWKLIINVFYCQF